MFIINISNEMRFVKLCNFHESVACASDLHWCSDHETEYTSLQSFFSLSTDLSQQKEVVRESPNEWYALCFIIHFLSSFFCFCHKVKPLSFLFFCLPFHCIFKGTKLISTESLYITRPTAKHLFVYEHTVVDIFHYTELMGNVFYPPSDPLRRHLIYST